MTDQAVTRDTIESQMLAFNTTEEWLEARTGTIGASQIAAVLNRDPMDPAGVRVFMDKTGRPLDMGVDADILNYGNDAEEGILTFAARKIAEDRPGLQVVMYDRVLLKHPTSRIHASPDALVFDPDGLLLGGLDAKNVREFMRKPWHKGEEDHWGEPGTDLVPRRVLDQCVTSAGLFGVPWWSVWAAIGGEPPVSYPVAPPAPMFDTVCEMVDAWCVAHIDADVLPNPEKAGKVGEQALAAFYPDGAVRLLDAGETELALGRKLRDSKAAVKAAKALETEAKNALKAILVAEKAAGVAGVCAWDAVRGKITTKWPAVLEQVVEETAAEFAKAMMATNPTLEADPEHTQQLALTAARDIVTRAQFDHTGRGKGHQAMRCTMP